VIRPLLGDPSAKYEIRLGDIVVSRPTGTSGGVIQYDFGKTIQEGRFVRTGSLNRPPNVLLQSVSEGSSWEPNKSSNHVVAMSKHSAYLLLLQKDSPGTMAAKGCWIWMPGPTIEDP